MNKQSIFTIIGFIAVRQIFFPGAKCGEDWLKEHCAEETKRWAGHVFSGEVRADRMYPGPGMKVTLEYTVINYDAVEIPHGFEAAMKESLKSDAATQAQLQLYAEKGVAVECNLYPRDQKMVATMTF